MQQQLRVDEHGCCVYHGKNLWFDLCNIDSCSTTRQIHSLELGGALEIANSEKAKSKDTASTKLSWVRKHQIAVRYGLDMLKFTASGLPMFLVAVLLNYLLVEWAHWPKSPVYAMLMVLQATVNFFICRRWVFGRRDAHQLWQEFGTFFAGIMGFRVFDWLLYTLCVQVFGLYFIAVQLGNGVLFEALKFLFSERLFRRNPELTNIPHDRKPSP